MINRAAILGTGSFGTAIAKLLSPKLEEILIVGRDFDVVHSINHHHVNSKYLSSIALPHHLKASTSMDALKDYPLVIFAVPTSATLSCAVALSNLGIPKETILLSSAKGIEKDTMRRMSRILSDSFPVNPIAVISGPNHAEELACGQPACAVIGSSNEEISQQLQQLFSLPHFRAYTSLDVAGIELGGAIKNVYAIAAGIAHGLKLGDNAVAALVTRALAEMTRLGVALGGQVETFAGLSGVGDLLVTCFSEHSRNHRVGFALGNGKSLQEATESLGMVAEGVPNTLSIYEASERIGARTPIIDSVYSILYQNKPAAIAMRDLLSRDPRPENS